jgi:prevent-host-death family protein
VRHDLFTITDAKAKLPEIVRRAADHDVTLLRHGRPLAVVIGMSRYEALLERLDDLEDRLSVYESRTSDPDLRLTHDKVKAELGLSE